MNNLPPMTLFDYMVSTRENNMLKAFLPYIDRDFQPMLATYIKYTELLATIDLFSRQGRNVFTSKVKASGFTDIISSMLPYVSDKEREAFETISNIKNAMEMFETYKDMMSSDMMNAFTGFGETSDSTSDEVLNNEENSGSNTDTMSNDDTPIPSNNANDSNGNNMSDMLSTMLSPEQLIMFEQLSGMMNNQ